MGNSVEEMKCMALKLDKCLKSIAFRRAILYRVQSFLSLRIELNFRHLSSYGTIVKAHFIFVNFLMLSLYLQR